MPKNNVRVNIPTNPTDQISLLGKVAAKHANLGAASPLGGLEWTKVNPALANAKTHDDLATEAATSASQTDALKRASDK